MSRRGLIVGFGILTGALLVRPCLRALLRTPPTTALGPGQGKALLREALQRETVRHEQHIVPRSRTPDGRLLPFVSRDCFEQTRRFGMPMVVRPAGDFHKTYMYDQIRQGNAFAWIRLGDGEIDCMARLGGGPEWSCDEVTTRALQRMLASGPDHVFVAVGTWWACRAPYGQRLAKGYAEATGGDGKAGTAPPTVLLDSFYLEHARADRGSGLDFGMVDAVRRSGRPVVIVGSSELCQLPRALYPIAVFLVVPPARMAVRDDVPDLMRRLSNASLDERVHLVLVSAGVAGKIFIHAAAQDPTLMRHIYVDVGSSLDVFVGKQTRDHNGRDARARHCKRFRTFMKDGLCA